MKVAEEGHLRGVRERRPGVGGVPVFEAAWRRDPLMEEAVERDDFALAWKSARRVASARLAPKNKYYRSGRACVPSAGGVTCDAVSV